MVQAALHQVAGVSVVVGLVGVHQGLRMVLGMGLGASLAVETTGMARRVTVGSVGASGGRPAVMIGTKAKATQADLAVVLAAAVQVVASAEVCRFLSYMNGVEYIVVIL